MSLGPAELADRMACEDVVFRYVDAINRRRPEALREVFAPDGEWHVPGLEPAIGIEAIEARLAEMILPAVVQVPTGIHVEVDGDRARGSCYVREEGRTAEGKDVTIIGRYDDDYVRTPDGWRFARRVFTLLYRGWRDPVGRWYPPDGA